FSPLRRRIRQTHDAVALRSRGFRLVVLPGAGRVAVTEVDRVVIERIGRIGAAEVHEVLRGLDREGFLAQIRMRCAREGEGGESSREAECGASHESLLSLRIARRSLDGTCAKGHHRSMQTAKRIARALLVLLVSGCAPFLAANQPLTHFDPTYGYRPTPTAMRHPMGDGGMILAVS